MRGPLRFRRTAPPGTSLKLTERWIHASEAASSMCHTEAAALVCTKRANAVAGNKVPINTEIRAAAGGHLSRHTFKQSLPPPAHPKESHWVELWSPCVKMESHAARTTLSRVGPGDSWRGRPGIRPRPQEEGKAPVME